MGIRAGKRPTGRVCISVLLLYSRGETVKTRAMERETNEIGEGSQRHCSGLISERSYMVGKIK